MPGVHCSCTCLLWIHIPLHSRKRRVLFSMQCPVFHIFSANDNLRKLMPLVTLKSIFIKSKLKDFLNWLKIIMNFYLEIMACNWNIMVGTFQIAIRPNFGPYFHKKSWRFICSMWKKFRVLLNETSKKNKIKNLMNNISFKAVGYHEIMWP